MITFGFFHSVQPDPDTKAFLQATGINNTVIEVAVNNLVVNLKDANLWTKLKALWPMVGGTADTCKYNLKNPAANTLTFVNAPTIDADGVSWNGTTQYANTNLAPGTAGLTGMHIMYYSLTASPVTARVQMGSRTGSNLARIVLNSTGTSKLAVWLGGTTSSIGEHIKHTATSQGLFVASWVNGTTIRAHQNGVSLGTSSQVAGSIAAITNNMYLGAYNDAGTPSLFTSMKCGVASIGDTFSDAEAITYSNIINQFCQQLSKNTY